VSTPALCHIWLVAGQAVALDAIDKLPPELDRSTEVFAALYSDWNRGPASLICSYSLAERRVLVRTRAS